MDKEACDQALAILESMSVAERAIAIHGDLASGQFRFACLDPFDLAYLLDVPHPDMLENSWHFVTAAEVRSLEAQLENNYTDGAAELIFLLREIVDEHRFKQLEIESEKYDAGARSDLHFLHSNEREYLERILAKEDLQGLLENGIGCTAYFCVQIVGIELWFNAQIEDDGHCFLMNTPYTGAEGPNGVLSNPNYVYEDW